MKKLVYSVICLSLISSFAMADHLNCKVNEQRSPSGQLTSQYELNGAAENEGVMIMTMGKTFADTVGMEIDGTYKRANSPEGNLSVQFTINGAKKNSISQLVEVNGTHLTYDGPVGRGFIQLDCDVKP